MKNGKGEYNEEQEINGQDQALLPYRGAGMRQKLSIFIVKLHEILQSEVVIKNSLPTRTDASTLTLQTARARNRFGTAEA